MSNAKANNVVFRIFENQGIDLDDKLVSEATKTVQQALPELMSEKLRECRKSSIRLDFSS